MTNSMSHVDLTAGLPRHKTLVCVTDQKNCDRIIRAGKTLARLTDSDLSVLNISLPTCAQDPESMEYLFSVSKENDAEMTIVYSNDVAKALTKYIKANKISFMLTGVPSSGSSVTAKVWQKFTHVTFFVVEPDGSLQEIYRPAKMAQSLASASVLA